MNKKIEKDQVINGQKEQAVNILDILKYLFFHWKWFLLSIVIFGGYYLYQYSKTPFMYSQSQTVMIKTPMNTPTTARITRTNVAYNSVSVASEILQLRSKELMRQTISRIHADVSYTRHIGLRDHELYQKSPVQVSMPEKSPDDSYSFTVTPVDAKHVVVKNWGEGSSGKELKVELDKEVKTPFGVLVITPSPYFKEDVFGQDIRVTKYAREAMVGYFMGNLRITQMEEDASLLQITLNDRSAERAADLITMLITVYNEFSSEDKNQIAINTAEFIHERLAIIESELGSVESSIERLRTANQGVDVSTAGQMYLTDSRQYQTEKTKIETDIKLAGMMREYLTNKTKQHDLIPNNTGLVDASVENQIIDYNSTLLKRNRLVEGSSSANPVVQDLDKALGAMRNNIDRAVDNTLEGLSIKMKNVENEVRQARGKAMQVPEKQRVMLSVERQQKVKEELYLFLLNKREENALNQAMTEDNIRIIDPASGSYAPIYPSRLRKIFTGMAIGVALPAVVLLLMLMLDTGVRGRQDIENVLSIPFLGEIPLKRNKQQEDHDISVTKTGRDPLTEAFRILRTNINFMAKDSVPPQVLTFTSFNIGAGKTFSVMNLGTTLSFLEKKVVVLDLDLRKGTLSSRLQIAKGKGVSHYLSDFSVSVDEIIYKSDLTDNMDFIPIGVIAPNPVELLLGKRLDELIAELKKRYDYVIVDGVPVGIVADASIVDRISDLTLFIIRVGKMDRRQLPELEKIHQSGKLSNLAVLLNGIKLGGSGYGYGYGGYGYGGYGYGYGYEIKKKRSFIGLLKKKL